MQISLVPNHKGTNKKKNFFSHTTSVLSCDTYLNILNVYVFIYFQNLSITLEFEFLRNSALVNIALVARARSLAPTLIVMCTHVQHRCRIRLLELSLRFTIVVKDTKNIIHSLRITVYSTYPPVYGIFPVMVTVKCAQTVGSIVVSSWNVHTFRKPTVTDSHV